VELVAYWVAENPIRVPWSEEVLNQPVMVKFSGLELELRVSSKPVDPLKPAAVEERVVMVFAYVTP
jgi:hypothetical protein